MLAQRRLTAASAERRPEVVHLYGTRLLSAPECLDYFKRFEPTGVEVIDENTCTSLEPLSACKMLTSTTTQLVQCAALLHADVACSTEWQMLRLPKYWTYTAPAESNKVQQTKAPLLFIRDVCKALLDLLENSVCLCAHSGNIAFRDGPSASSAVLDMGSFLPSEQAPDQLGEISSFWV